MVLIVGGGAFAYSVVHRFIHFGARARAAEARKNLPALCEARARQQLGTVPSMNWYWYFLGGAQPDVRMGVLHFPPLKEVTVADLPARFAGDRGLGATSDCWVGAAAANLDEDPALDVWSVATCARPGVAPCIPFHERDDVPGAWDFLKR